VKILSDVSETVSVSIIKDSCDEDCVYIVLGHEHKKIYEEHHKARPVTSNMNPDH
jgi:hypothetical protein